MKDCLKIAEKNNGNHISGKNATGQFGNKHNSFNLIIKNEPNRPQQGPYVSSVGKHKFKSLTIITISS